MKCPKCQRKTEVTDSRPAPNNRIRRRRGCPNCSHTFTTYESTDISEDKAKLLRMQEIQLKLIDKRVRALQALMRRMEKASV